MQENHKESLEAVEESTEESSAEAANPEIINEEEANEDNNTVIQYILDTSSMSDAVSDAKNEESQYTVVSFQNGEEVSESQGGPTILSSTVNADGTTTYMVMATEENEENNVVNQVIEADKNVLLLRIEQTASDNAWQKSIQRPDRKSVV